MDEPKNTEQSNESMPEQQQDHSSVEENKVTKTGGIGTIGIAIPAVVVLVVGVLAYLYFFSGNDGEVNNGVSPTNRPTIVPSEATAKLSPTVKLTPTPDLTVGWKTYRDESISFSFKYPPEMEELEASDRDIKLWIQGPNQPDNAGIIDGILVSSFKTTKEPDIAFKDWMEEKRLGEARIDELLYFNIGRFQAARMRGQFVEQFDVVYIELSSHNILALSGSYAGGDQYKEKFNKIINSIQLD